MRTYSVHGWETRTVNVSPWMREEYATEDFVVRDLTRSGVPVAFRVGACWLHVASTRTGEPGSVYCSQCQTVLLPPVRSVLTRKPMYEDYGRGEVVSLRVGFWSLADTLDVLTSHIAFEYGDKEAQALTALHSMAALAVGSTSPLEHLRFIGQRMNGRWAQYAAPFHHSAHHDTSWQPEPYIVHTPSLQVVVPVQEPFHV